MLLHTILTSTWDFSEEKNKTKKTTTFERHSVEASYILSSRCLKRKRNRKKVHKGISQSRATGKTATAFDKWFQRPSESRGTDDSDDLMQQAFIHNYRSLASTQVHLPGRKCRLGLFKLYLYQQPAGPRCRRLCWLRNQTWTWASAMDFCDHQSKTARNDRRRVVAAMMTPLTLADIKMWKWAF